jgi:hypothetical protein
MNNLQTPSRGWGKQKAKLKALYPCLLEADFLYEYGHKEEMMENLQRKIGTTRSGLIEIISETKAFKKYYK